MRALWLTLLATWAKQLQCERVMLRPHMAEADRRGARRPRAAKSALLAAFGVAAAGAVTSRELFDEIDLDSDGQISASEFQSIASNVISSWNLRVDDVGRVDAEAFFARLHGYADIDGDGSLNLREMEYSNMLDSWAGQARTVQMVANAAKKQHAAGGAQASGSWPVVEDEFDRESALRILEDHDKDGDGKLSRAEYDVGMRQSSISWGWKEFIDDPEVLQWYTDLFVYGDVDGDGMLNLKETHYVATLSDQYFRSDKFADKKLACIMFAELDGNRDGRIEREEVEQVSAQVDASRDRMGPKGRTLVDRILAYFGDADADGDAALDRGEAGRLAARLVGEEL